MQLQRLTGLEQEKIVNEYREVMDTIADLLDILAKPERITKIIAQELSATRDEFGDERRSEIVTNAQDLSMEDLIAPEDVVVNPFTQRLRQGAAAGRLPRAKTRRTGQAGNGDKGRRFHRQSLHRQYSRLRSVLLSRGQLYWIKSITSRKAAGPAAASPLSTCCP
jgi:DNA gyrase subunit A